MIDRMVNKMIVWLMVTMIALFWGAVALIPISILYKGIASQPLMELSEGVMRARSAKLSYKGLIWKTTDGWIPIGVDSEGGLKKWHFTVEDDNEKIIDCINNNDRVKLYYTDYILTPYKMGNSHQVHGCEVIK